MRIMSRMPSGACDAVMEVYSPPANMHCAACGNDKHAGNMQAPARMRHCMFAAC
jgi:hypothetical protein